MNILKRTVVFSLLVSPLNLYAAGEIDFHGYFRSGAGANSEGGDQVCFKLSGAKSKYRLGNECETYGSLSLGSRVFEDEDGSWFRVQTQLAYESAAEKDFEDYKTAMREVYVEGGGLLEGRWKHTNFWAGKRLLRKDVHLNDFFYWDNSGAGGGFNNLTFDNFKLSYSLIQNVKDGFNDGAPINEGGDHAVTTHDLRFYDIETNTHGKLTVGLAGIQSSLENNNGGWQLHLEHEQKPLWDGFNRLTLQYGSGAGATLDKNPDDTLDNSAQTWRLVEQLTVNNIGNWSGQAVFLYEEQKDVQQWLSFGVRPIYHFSDHVNLAMELGYDQVEPEVGDTLQLTKLTLAPQLSAGRGFFSRPVLRLFITYADWNDAARDALVNPVAGGTDGVFGQDSSGLSYGIQAEAWW